MRISYLLWSNISFQNLVIYKINDYFYFLTGQFWFRVFQGISQMSPSATPSEGLTGAGGATSKMAHLHGCHSHAGDGGPLWSKWPTHRGAKCPAGMQLPLEWAIQDEGGNCNASYDLDAEVTHCCF